LADIFVIVTLSLTGIKSELYRQHTRESIVIRLSSCHDYSTSAAASAASVASSRRQRR